MTRHTRNRQLQKLNSVLAFNTTGCNISIESSKKNVCYTDLDPTFKWERTEQLVLFKRGLKRRGNKNSIVNSKLSLFNWGKYRRLHNTVSFDVQELKEGGIFHKEKRMVTKTKIIDTKKKKVRTKTKGWRTVR